MKFRKPSHNFQLAEQHVAQRQAENANNPRLTVEQTARYLGVSIPTLNRWRGAGTGPSWIKLGGRVFYHLTDLQSFRS